MKKQLWISLILWICLILLGLGTGHVSAFDLVTAQEAYDMISSGEAIMIDVRTLEECVFVGSPALEPNGDPVAYLIPWKIFKGIDENGMKKFTANSDFDELVKQTFGDDKDQTLIVMCGCGIRSTFAAERLEQLGFTNVYELDNRLREVTNYPGGSGGFEGICYNDLCEGYCGYPHRMTDDGSDKISLETVSSDIDNENDTVSWMDTGLPITKKADPNKIPKIKQLDSSSKTSKTNQSILSTFFPFMNYPWSMPYMTQSPYSNLYYPLSPMGSMYPYQQSYLSNTYYQPNFLLFPYTTPQNTLQIIPGQFFNYSCDEKEPIGSS